MQLSDSACEVCEVVAWPRNGVAVRLRRLKSRPDLNGSIGIVMGTEEQRYAVALEIDGQLQEAFLRLESLEPSDCYPSWYFTKQRATMMASSKCTLCPGTYVLSPHNRQRQEQPAQQEQ